MSDASSAKRNLPSWMSSDEKGSKSRRKKQDDDDDNNTKLSRLLDGVVFVLSGFVNPDQSALRSQALEMGAEYRPDWNPYCTLLVCAFSNMPKFKQVGADCGTIVSKVLKAQMIVKSKGFTYVLYLDAMEKKYLEEASSCIIFIVKGGVISTPLTRGTILSGVTRRSIIEIACDYGYKVKERLVSVEDLMDAKEAFCMVTAVVVSPVRSMTYRGQRNQMQI